MDERVLPTEELEQAVKVAGEKKVAGRHRIQCPLCEGDRLKRQRRAGFLERAVLPIFGYYPWRCSRCGGRILLKRRGAPLRRQKRMPDEEHSDGE